MVTNDFLLDNIWSRTMQALTDTSKIQEEVLNYIKNSKLRSLENGEATVTVPQFLNLTLIERYKEHIELCLKSVLEYNLDTDEVIPLNVIQDKDFIKSQVISNSFTDEFISQRIDTNMTFMNFVIGKSNIQAQFAALSCANNPGMVYNPLFIYGNSGLGKTHLLNAVGNQIMLTSPGKRIGFISGLDFVEGVSKARNENRFESFKESFKNLDVLLVDDIQFIAGKEKSHEMFFTIFNELVNNRKQICVTADRTPSEIKGLEERLISRFNQGLTVSIEAPEYETSINILKMELESLKIEQSVDDEVLSYIATNFSQDVRALKGAVKRLLFYSINFSDSDIINIELAIDAFKDQIIENYDKLTINKIRKEVCNYYNITRQQICSSSRTKNILNARGIAMYLCRKLLDAPYKTIGNEFGKRDHTTVMNALEKVEKLIKTDPLYLKVIMEIEGRLK